MTAAVFRLALAIATLIGPMVCCCQPVVAEAAAVVAVETPPACCHHCIDPEAVPPCGEPPPVDDEIPSCPCRAAAAAFKVEPKVFAVDAAADLHQPFPFPALIETVVAVRRPADGPREPRSFPYGDGQAVLRLLMILRC
ncbi:MAG: hypothetical protein ACRC1K_02385 [Planctomycetia bacterium]